LPIKNVSWCISKVTINKSIVTVNYIIFLSSINIVYPLLLHYRYKDFLTLNRETDNKFVMRIMQKILVI